MEYKEFNLNYTVKVRLNKMGFIIHKEHFKKVIEEYKLKYYPPQVDEDGYSVFQLWELMMIFGDHLHLGITPPFDTNMMIEMRDE